jgi:hypothetical protein
MEGVIRRVSGERSAVILSAAKDPFHLTQDKLPEKSLHLPENSNAGILRFAQDDSVRGFSGAVILSPFAAAQGKLGEESLHLPENSNTGILRCAQDDSERTQGDSTGLGQAGKGKC